MSEKVAVDLGSVQKTLFLPLWGRAFESKKAKPLLVDKAALEIIEKVDYDLSTTAQNMHELTQIAWIMRSICVDKVIRQFLHDCPKATVVNIGCGLDTTFDRVDNGSLVWYDLDLPDVIRLRRAFIAETGRRKFISASFLDRGWLKDIEVTDGVLFIAAGVFYYFEEYEIKDFLIRLADSFPGGEIVFDVSSPYGVKVANRAVIRNAGLDETSFLKWGLASTQTIASWDKRFRILATYSYFRQKNTSLTLRNKLLGLLSDLLRIQYLVHLQLMN